MSDKSLVQYFKNAPILTTNVGDFTFVKNIGQGGNAWVMEFKKGIQQFAIKFILHGDAGKLKRFKDEYFCAAQIPTHKNIVQGYHFDMSELDGAVYSLIVMKHYDTTLHKIGSISAQPKALQGPRVYKLFADLLNGLHHLHTHKIVHRDIKPHNIFFDESSDKFVIGDLGIAHFSPDVFAKEALTKSTERLANYLFSAPEQSDSKNPAIPANDIYALGQVIQWYLGGATIRGLGRPTFAADDAQTTLKMLDGIVDVCLRNDPARRFQSVKDIKTFVEDFQKPKSRDPRVKLHAFDDVIRRTFTQIRRIAETTNPLEIEKFIKNFQQLCQADEFWYVNGDGGDNTYAGLEKLDGGDWLFNEMDEIDIKKLLVFRDEGYPYKNFFILLTAPAKPFKYVDFQGQSIERKKSALAYDDDVADIYESKYIDPAETANGYYTYGNKTVEVTRDEFKSRHRYLKPYAFLIVPKGTASAGMTNRKPTTDLLASAIVTSRLEEATLEKYLQATREHHSPEITMWN